MSPKNVDPNEARSLEDMLARLAVVRRRKDWLNTDDVVEITGVHEITVYRWRSQGLMAHTVRPARGGRANRYKPDEVEAFLRGRFGVEGAAEATAASKKTQGGSNASGDRKKGKAKAKARRAST